MLTELFQNFSVLPSIINMLFVISGNEGAYSPRKPSLMIRNILTRHELFYREFGVRLAAERKNKGLTQEQFAKLADLSRTSITNIECGRQRVQLHQIYDFANILRVDVQSILPKGNAMAEPESLAESKQDKYVAEVLRHVNAATFTGERNA
jgi:transcriptional regulator with XRE-family HTH domain